MKTNPIYLRNKELENEIQIFSEQLNKTVDHYRIKLDNKKLDYQ